MSAYVVEAGYPFNLTATGDVGKAGVDGTLLGFYVNTTSSGVIVFRIGGSGGTVVTGSITPAAGAFHRFPMLCPGGLHLTLSSGSINVTLFYIEGSA